MEAIKLNIPEPESHKYTGFDFDNFVFGVQPTDHIFLCDFREGKWQSPRIEMFRNLSVSPLALCLHYGQTVFEGMKAFRQQDGRIHIFRPEKHLQRMNRSLDRMCMPFLDKELFYAALETLVRLDQNWLPEHDDLSLYIRPFVIATEPRLGVKISEEYLFAVVCSPLTAYYAQPLRVKVETKYTRAPAGGAGYAKYGGNYGGAFYPTQRAKEEGFDQVIWTDAQTHTLLEEAGTMNIMLIRDHRLITPPAGETILGGGTRDSLIHIASDIGLEIEERPVCIQELTGAFRSAEKIEIFGCGTAAVISPVCCVSIHGVEYAPYHREDAEMFKLKAALNDIRKGKIPDLYGWNHFV